MKKKKKIIVASIIVVALVAIIGVAVFIVNKGKGVKKEKIVEKNITVIIENPEVEVKEYKVVTKGKYVKDALDDAEGLEIEYDERFEEVDIIAINGRERTMKREYWDYTINGEHKTNTIESQKIADGDTIKVALLLWDPPIE